MAKSRGFGGIILPLLVLAAAGAGAWYYWNEKADQHPEISTTKIARGDITQVVTATGDIQSVTSVDVSSQISGQIVEVLVDFNTPVKTGQVLAKLDPASYTQKLRAAKADLSSSEASNTLQRLNTERVRELRNKNLVSQQELDQAEALLKQSEAHLATRQSAVDDADVNLQRCTIYSPIDGIVLARFTDKGRIVSASTSAPTLFTIVNDLTKMQIAAAVAEADIGSIGQGQDVTFTVDAFPSRSFRGRVTQVRNAAKVVSNVVSYDTIIEVSNDDLKLKPGMTANVSIVVAQRNSVLHVANSALRVRIPPELIVKTVAPVTEKTPAKPAAPAMTDEDRRSVTMGIMREAGWAGLSAGASGAPPAPPPPEIIAKAQQLAKEKGLDLDFSRFASTGQRGDDGRRGSGNTERAGMISVVTTRTLYRLQSSDPKHPQAEPIAAKLGISDGLFTEVLEGLMEDEVLITSVTMPGAQPAVLQGPPGGGANNPFQGGGRSSGGRGR